MKSLLDSEFEQEFPSSLDASRAAAQELNQFWIDVGISAGLATQLELCVVEMVNNAFIHAYAQKEGLPVGVKCHFIEEAGRFSLCLDIEDIGSAMSQSELDRALSGEFIEADPDDESTWRTSGRGFLIVSSLMDHVLLDPHDNVNRFRMIKVLEESELTEALYS